MTIIFYTKAPVRPNYHIATFIRLKNLQRILIRILSRRLFLLDLYYK